jgi:hypothetical protein
VRGRRLERAAIFLAIAFSTVAASSSCRRGPTRREERLIAQLDSMRAQFKATREVRDDLASRARTVLIDSLGVEHLRLLGLHDPLHDLEADLRLHPELIPVSPRGGESFGFHGTIYLLTEKWVLAEFNDGLVGGSMILEFTVGDSARITWKPITWAWG